MVIYIWLPMDDRLEFMQKRRFFSRKKAIVERQMEKDTLVILVRVAKQSVLTSVGANVGLNRSSSFSFYFDVFD